MCLAPDIPPMPEPKDPLAPAPAPAAPLSTPLALKPPETVSAKDTTKLGRKSKRGKRFQAGSGAEQLRIELANLNTGTGGTNSNVGTTTKKNNKSTGTNVPK